MEKDKRQKLLDAAINEFNERGYNEASLNRILKETGISKGSFYHRFKNKSELYLYIFEELKKMDYEIFGKLLGEQSLEPGRLNIFDLLKLTTDAGLELCLSRPDYYIFYKRALNESVEEIRTVLASLNEQYLNQYALPLFINPGIESGQLRSDLSLDFYKSLITDMTRHVMDWVIAEDEKGKVDSKLTAARMNEYLSFLKYGIAGRVEGSCE